MHTEFKITDTGCRFAILTDVQSIPVPFGLQVSVYGREFMHTSVTFKLVNLKTGEPDFYFWYPSATFMTSHFGDSRPDTEKKMKEFIDQYVEDAVRDIHRAMTQYGDVFSN